MPTLFKPQALGAEIKSYFDSLYSAVTHNHNSAYSAITHNHDSAYSAASHNHNSAYSALGHNHDTAYAPKRLWLPMSSYDQLAGLPGISGTNINPFVGPVDRTVTFTSYVQCCYILTTNNASNYWGIVLRRLSDGALIASFPTSGLTPGGWRFLSTTSFSIASIGTAHVGCYINVTKVGAPGNLLMAAPMVEITY